ncbi:MAG: hypothetical protein HQK50_14075 [Oligoflexia bacterium]|nr:hypothetical protein [Oligoflexia bacterium]
MSIEPGPVPKENNNVGCLVTNQNGENQENTAFYDIEGESKRLVSPYVFIDSYGKCNVVDLKEESCKIVTNNNQLADLYKIVTAVKTSYSIDLGIKEIEHPYGLFSLNENGNILPVSTSLQLQDSEQVFYSNKYLGIDYDNNTPFSNRIQDMNHYLSLNSLDIDSFSINDPALSNLEPSAAKRVKQISLNNWTMLLDKNSLSKIKDKFPNLENIQLPYLFLKSTNDLSAIDNLIHTVFKKTNKQKISFSLPRQERTVQSRDDGQTDSFISGTIPSTEDESKSVPIQKTIFPAIISKKELNKINSDLEQYVFEFSIDLYIPHHIRAPEYITYEFFCFQKEKNEQGEYAVAQEFSIVETRSVIKSNIAPHRLRLSKQDIGKCNTDLAMVISIEGSDVRFNKVNWKLLEK